MGHLDFLQLERIHQCVSFTIVGQVQRTSLMREDFLSPLPSGIRHKASPISKTRTLSSVKFKQCTQGFLGQQVTEGVNVELTGIRTFWS